MAPSAMYASVAQWIERSPPERKAAGSNPVRCILSLKILMKALESERGCIKACIVRKGKNTDILAFC